MPTGGDLKRMVMLALTGECNVVMLEFEMMGGGNWPLERGTLKRRVETKARTLEKALNFCYRG